MTQLTQEERNTLLHRYGAGFCKCVLDKLDQITPQMLHAYCEYRRFRPFPAPMSDPTGTRYSYLLFTREIEDPDPEKKEKRTQNVVAAFHDFPKFPRANAEGILEALTRIALLDGVSPSTVADDVVALSQPSKTE